MKTCDKCGSAKNAFEPHRQTCRSCRADYKRKATRTCEGHIKKIYHNQVRASKMRGHSQPAYSLSDLTSWILGEVEFRVLFDAWQEGGYDKWLAPSVDRIDNQYGYSLENVRLVTWQENSDQAHIDCQDGVLSTGSPHVAVVQEDLIGNKVARYVSLRAAALALGKNCHKEIGKCCRGVHQTCQGFKWKFATDGGAAA